METVFFLKVRKILFKAFARIGETGRDRKSRTGSNQNRIRLFNFTLKLLDRLFHCFAFPMFLL
ncbi:MAG: hypothetical protein ACOX8E_11860 [Ruminococcus sp.]